MSECEDDNVTLGGVDIILPVRLLFLLDNYERYRFELITKSVPLEKSPKVMSSRHNTHSHTHTHHLERCTSFLILSKCYHNKNDEHDDDQHNEHHNRRANNGRADYDDNHDYDNDYDNYNNHYDDYDHDDDHAID